MTKRALAIAIAILSVSLAADAAPAGGDTAKNPIDDFFKAFNAQPDTFAEYRFLTSPAVQQDAQTRNMASQMLATHLSFLGRPMDARRAFPYRGKNAPESDLPLPSDWRAMPASAWIAAQADDYRVVMLNEAHHAPQTRVLTIALLQQLREKAYTHLAVEALLNDGTDPMPSGYPVRKTGIYTREPVFAELLREALRLGYRLVPYETPNNPGERQQDRESGQARAIAAVLAENPQWKVLVHAGYAHIGEAQQGLPGDARPMAMELAKLSRLQLLTIDQTSTRSYEAADIDTVGQRVAKQFAVNVPSVLVSREGGGAWSYRPGLYDVSVLLPAAPAGEAQRPDWLSLGGKRLAVAIDLTPCLVHLPCLAEARPAGEGDDAIPSDQFLMLAASEASTPLYLAPGKYRLRLVGADGGPLVERSLEVPLTEHHHIFRKDAMNRLDDLLHNNRAWAERISREDPGFFERLSRQQTPKYLWIGCSDSRVPANQVVDLAPGEVFVHRNIANVVVHTDLNCLSVIQFAVDVLKVEHVLVVGHYGCGGVHAALTNARVGLADNWIRHVGDVSTKHAQLLLDAGDEPLQHDRLCELNALEQVANVCQTTIVRDAWARGQVLSVHGWVYTLRDGRVHDLGLNVAAADQLEPQYAAALAAIRLDREDR